MVEMMSILDFRRGGYEVAKWMADGEGVERNIERVPMAG